MLYESYIFIISHAISLVHVRFRLSASYYGNVNDCASEKAQADVNTWRNSYPAALAYNSGIGYIRIQKKTIVFHSYFLENFKKFTNFPKSPNKFCEFQILIFKF